MCEACEVMEKQVDKVKEEQERIINKIVNDKEQRWINDDFDIDESALRKFLVGEEVLVRKEVWD